MQHEEVDGDDDAADAAAARLVEEGHLKPLRSGRLWYSSTFRHLAELDRYLETSPRYAGFARGTRARLAVFRRDRLILRRVIRYTVYGRLP